MGEIRLLLLGGFELRAPGDHAIRIALKKAKALLAFLALKPGQRHARDRLSALLWEESREAQARLSLRQALVNLRKALPNAEQILAADAGTVSLLPDSIEVDVLAFERLLAADTPESLVEAMGLYQGEFLEGFTSRSMTFEDWLMAERSHLREQALAAMARLLDHYLGSGLMEPACRLAIRLLALDPLREAVHRTLMQIYAKQGRYAAALKQYRVCRAVLQRELGVGVEPQTHRLYQDLLGNRRQAGAETGRAYGPLQDAIATPVEPEPRQLAVLTVRPAPPAELPARDLIAHEVERYGATLIRDTPMSCVALFGVPVAHSDDAERAARAALQIRQALGEPGRVVRMGITGGQVLIRQRTGIDGEGIEASGEVLDRSQELATRAGPDEIWIDTAIHHCIATRFRIEPASSQDQRWRLVTSDAHRPATGRSSFVGRRAELLQFTAACEAALDTGCGQSFLIRGEAGIGKTRLVTELQAIAQSLGFSGAKAQVLDFGVSVGEDAVGSLLRGLLNPAPGGHEAGAAWSGLEPEQTMALNDLLGLSQPAGLGAAYAAMDGAARRRGKQSVMAHVLHAVNERCPLLLVVEDIHWADHETLGHLAQLAAAVHDGPALLVMTTRVEGEPLAPGWRAAMQWTPLTTLDLGPLRAEEARALATELKRGADSGLIERCLRRAGGHPLFIEQLVFAPEVGDDVVPDSVNSIVWSRLDRLPSADKQAAQAASALGQHFPLAALRYLVDTPEYDCAPLVQQRLLRPDEEHFWFAHALIMQGVYASMLPAKRRALHRRAADWYLARDAVLHAEHQERANDIAAPRSYLAAAQSEALHYRYDAALQLVERGLRLAKDPRTEHELTLLLGELRAQSGETEGSVQAFRRARALSRDAAEACRALLGVAAACKVSDRYDEALAALDEAESLAKPRELIHDLAQIHYHRGAILFVQGRIEECSAMQKLALEYAHEAAVPRLEACALSGLADAQFQRGRMISAHGYFERSIEICRSHGLEYIQVPNLAMRGYMRFFQLRLTEAMQDCLQAIALGSRVGNRRGEGIAHNLAATVAHYAGDDAAAVKHAERGLALCRHIESKRFEADNLLLLGAALARLGKTSEGEKHLKQAYGLCRGPGLLPYVGPWILGAMAVVTRDPGDRRTLLMEGEALLGEGCVGHNFHHFYQLAIEASLASRDWAEADRYATALEEYTREEPLPWVDFFVSRGRVLASYGRGERNAAISATLRALRGQAQQAGMLAAVKTLPRFHTPG